MSMPVGPSSPQQAAQWAAVNAAQSPADLMAAAQAAGLTGDAAGLAAAGAAPVQAPTFEEQLQASQAANAALQDQINRMQQQFGQALAGLQQGLNAVQSQVPQRVDPVAESAGKVVQHFLSLAASDARNGLRSALHSHLIVSGLEELAKLI